MKKLSDFGCNVYSQFGEDGIIAKIFEIIGTTSEVCVEFGAWDGFHLSNTANLWAKQGWKGVLIEMEPARFKQLVENTKQFNCRCIASRVEGTGANTLENILKRESITEPIDLLSIDIDGDDYYVLQSLNELKPRLIICEYNPTIPAQMDLVPEPGNYFGCSAVSLVKLAEKKGYKLVAVTDTNCFFVPAADFPKFADYETSLAETAVTRHLTYLITGYAGDYLLSREPTYGCKHPSTQKIAQGEHFMFPTPAGVAQEVPARKRRPRMTEKIRQKVKKLFRDAPVKRFAREARELHATWEKAFAPVADQFVHPVWQKARPAFLPLIQNGVPPDFLKHGEVAHQFCRSGFGEPQQHELKYLRSLPQSLADLVGRYGESNIGCPTPDCAELQISANSLGMLYYFARIAEAAGLDSLQTIVEFGGGYGCLCRVFLELLPRTPTYIIVDLPEMLALQYVFLKASRCKVVPHTAAPLRIEPGSVNLVPVHLMDAMAVKPDLFVSTFALSETPRKLQEKVAKRGFMGSKSIYLVGQETDAKFWQHEGLDSPQALHRAVHDCFARVRLQPYHFAHAWELFASDPKSSHE